MTQKLPPTYDAWLMREPDEPEVIGYDYFKYPLYEGDEIYVLDDHTFLISELSKDFELYLSDHAERWTL